MNNGAGCIGFNAARQSADDGTFYFGSNGTRNGGALIWGDAEGGLSFSTRPSGTNEAGAGSGASARWLSAAWALNDRRLKINPSGQVQIGMTQVMGPHAANYKLAVDGKLVARSVIVTQQNWADFVFAPDYALLSLPELERYVQTHHHLPAVPPAAEVAAQGLDVGDIQARLLQQLEELTLHVIALGKQNQELRTQVAELAAQVRPAASIPSPAAR